MSAHLECLSGGVSAFLKPDTTITTNTTTNGSSFTIPNNANQLIAISNISSWTDGVYTTIIQHSPDGTNWYTWKAGTSQSNTGNVLIYDNNVPNFSNIRASISSSSVTSGATISVRLFYGLK